LLDEIVREGARRMLAAALEAEVNAYIAEFADERDAAGRRLVVRNGHHQPRKVTTEVLPLLYLHGLSSGDFVPALEQFLGTSAGLSAATVTRLTAQWQADH
jgi:putative transposase